ncbi:DNA-binding transcriptional regulator LsrR, DeoR family [Pseudorhodobacter antarcticus]|jgi:DNA-binding transcriptional regulator LsrR (DeoR family)|uniref:DNA-binding transcriptional regulator LsrR, DeoR family n=1 Tax=Pseudorhodobacter antarcticus TaxID=1077947 RepID=A0A1H8HAT3_9RHOB|nr:sugar-binding transcriptional regulator [Pseudorhodobacter antarcticus]SEN53285.1 DNA-binding transcriptional regulator LsrR, DeoR family [Pseudorhodobacter antarcticus]
MNTPDESLQDEAARAGWLYYVGGKTQDQIAVELGVSRQRAQRLVSRAMAEGLVHVRLEHKITACLELEAALARRFDLCEVRVAPGLGAGGDPNRAIAATAASVMEKYLRRTDPLVIAVGTGRALRASIDEIAPLIADQHRLVSLIGNIAPDGSATHFDVIVRLSDRVRALHFPMSVPVLSDTAAERALFQRLRTTKIVFELAQSADVTFVGVGQMTDDAPLRVDGFKTTDEMTDLRSAGATGEIAGWVFDAHGTYLDYESNARVGSVRVEAGRTAPTIGIAAGATKVRAIRAALTGRILNGLITDEPTAQALLSE